MPEPDEMKDIANFSFTNAIGDEIAEDKFNEEIDDQTNNVTAEAADEDCY